MNLLLRMADKRLPEFVKRRELGNLVRLTVSAFGIECPSTDGVSYPELLAGYARLTKTAVDEAAGRGENMQDIQERLFQRAQAYGSLWRKRFGVSSAGDVMKAARILYRAIEIEFKGTDQGAIEIDRCFFSPTYSPATCRVMSSLDAGILSGLSAGKSLSFSRRITEGFHSCRARLAAKESNQ
jgi:hypothetical protein